LLARRSPDRLTMFRITHYLKAYLEENFDIFPTGQKAKVFKKFKNIQKSIFGLPQEMFSRFDMFLIDIELAYYHFHDFIQERILFNICLGSNFEI
jgi:hypothetical protein